MCPAISRDSLMTLEAYAKARPEMRARVLKGDVAL